MVRPRKFTDAEILDRAREIFVEHGPSASTSLVAEAVGLSQAALFKRFGTKENLLLQALMPPARPAWVAMLGEGPDERPIVEQLTQVADAAVRFFEAMLPCMMTLKAAGLDLHTQLQAADRPAPLMARAALRRWFQVAIAQGRVRAIDPDALAFTFIGAMQSRAAFSHIFGAEPITDELRRAHVRGVVDALWGGLAPVPVPAERP